MKYWMLILVVLSLCLCGFVPVSAAPVYWADWTGGTVGGSGSASGVFTIGSSVVDIVYSGEIAFLQTGSGTNYWTWPDTYKGSYVDNAPPASELIALSKDTLKQLTFSQPVSDVFFALMSLNGNSYVFDQDFEIVSNGRGYWGSGTLTKEAVGDGRYRLVGTGEPHGVIKFTGPVSSIEWTTGHGEYWNGFSVGTYGIAKPVPEPAGLTALGLGVLSLIPLYRRR